MLCAILVTSVVANSPDVSMGVARFLYAVQPLVPAAQAAASTRVALAPRLRVAAAASAGPAAAVQPGSAMASSSSAASVAPGAGAQRPRERSAAEADGQGAVGGMVGSGFPRNRFIGRLAQTLI